MSNAQMLSLRGSAALSQFRLDKILTNIQTSVPHITHLYAEFWHFAWSETPLSDAQLEVLKQILTYGPKMVEETPSGQLLLVVPRPGTISPWSSRATDIARHCGLEAITRLERGMVYYVTTKDGGPLNESEFQALKSLIHDRMTEAVFLDVADASRLYHQAEPAPMHLVDILGGGKAALEAANAEMGLALSVDEVEYWT
jgi:phosphoribosylformylglycinamidine synthase